MSDISGHAEAHTVNTVTDVVLYPSSASAAGCQWPNGSVSQEKKSSRAVVDLRLLEYIFDFDRNLMCPICRCPFIDPVRLSCDHTYCKLCLSRTHFSQSDDVKTCPTCRKPSSTVDALPIPRFLLHMIDDLMVKCPQSGSGCDKRLRRSDVQNHVDFYCSYTELPCPSKDCNLKTRRKDLNDNCLHRAVECEYCQLQMPALDLDNHLDQTCTVRSTTCRFCELSLAQSELSKHVSECPEATQSCPAAAIGCKFISKKRQALDHSQSCPLAAILPSMSYMTRRMDDQETTLGMLRRKNAILEESFAAMQGLLAEPSAPSGLYAVNLPSQNSTTQRSPDSNQLSEAPPFDSATHHMLSLHESLREELDRVSAAISEVDGRASMTIINETLRIREELTHTNAVISSMRMQLQWLTSARLQAQPRGPGMSTIGSRGPPSTSSDGSPSQPTRRLSDSARQDTKL